MRRLNANLSTTCGMAVLALLLLVPAAARAQNGAIAGLVRDASGGVLPGVSVEAATPALIEKVRTASTDGQGQYKILDLRPGVYAVTFTLPGFRTVVRDGLELTAGTPRSTSRPTCPWAPSKRRSPSRGRPRWSTSRT